MGTELNVAVVTVPDPVATSGVGAVIVALAGVVVTISALRMPDQVPVCAVCADVALFTP